MRVELVGKHFEITDAIREYAEQKAAKLPRYYDGVQEIEVVLEGTAHSSFIAELRVDTEKHPTFVSKVEGPDVYESIDQASDKMIRQLTDFKEKLKNTKR